MSSATCALFISEKEHHGSEVKELFMPLKSSIICFSVHPFCSCYCFNDNGSDLLPTKCLTHCLRKTQSLLGTTLQGAAFPCTGCRNKCLLTLILMIIWKWQEKTQEEEQEEERSKSPTAGKRRPVRMKPSLIWPWKRFYSGMSSIVLLGQQHGQKQKLFQLQ